MSAASEVIDLKEKRLSGSQPHHFHPTIRVCPWSGSFRSWWGNRWTAIEVGLLFGFWLKDTQTGLRAVPRRLFPALQALGGERFEYEAGWFGLLKRLREPIRQVSIETIYRASNRTSHFRPWQDTLLTQRALFGRG